MKQFFQPERRSSVKSKTRQHSPVYRLRILRKIADLCADRGVPPTSSELEAELNLDLSADGKKTIGLRAVQHVLADLLAAGLLVRYYPYSGRDPIYLLPGSTLSIDLPQWTEDIENVIETESRGGEAWEVFARDQQLAPIVKQRQQ